MMGRGNEWDEPRSQPVKWIPEKNSALLSGTCTRIMCSAQLQEQGPSTIGGCLFLFIFLTFRPKCSPCTPPFRLRAGWGSSWAFWGLVSCSAQSVFSQAPTAMSQLCSGSADPHRIYWYFQEKLVASSLSFGEGCWPQGTSKRLL